MKKKIIILLAVSTLWCGKEINKKQNIKDQQIVPNTKNESIVKTSKPSPQKKTETDYPVITEVKFISEPKSKQDLIISAKLNKENNVAIFEYHWYVNDEEMTDTTGNILPKEKFKSGDWIHCRVTAITGNLESSMVKSKYVRIQGAPPILELGPLEAFNIPGQFQYKIIARDPDLEDYKETNTLSYELISPKGEGIILDEKTGEINWFLTEDTVKKLGDKIEIRFKVKKEGASEVSASIKLNFIPQSEE